jgi:DNA-binding NarL/FixJ family response regulator
MRFLGYQMVRILIADHDDIGRDRLRAMLNRHLGWEVCGEATTGRQAVQLARALKPDIIVLDLALPEMNGLVAAREIKGAQPEAEILILTSHETDDLIRDVLIAGARACLPKAETSKHITTAIDALSQHRPYLTQRTANAVLNSFLLGEKNGRATRPYRRLTPREREILQLLAEGRTNTEISRLLSITVKTVETHRASVMKKLGVSSLAELIRYAIRHSIIEDA